MRIRVTDMHTAGEPVRIVTDGYPALAGRTILERRRTAREQHDHLRRALMLEPRGHAGMYGVIPVEPSAPGCVIGALFMHNSGYSTMCGHATIALGKWLVESGRVSHGTAEAGFAIELPCGVVRMRCTIEAGRVVATEFESVPAFLAEGEIEVAVEGFGEVPLDIAYGGAFYAILPASALGLDLFATPLRRLTEAAVAVTEATRRQVPVAHPTEPDLGFLYGTILTDDAWPAADTAGLCVFAEGQIDRSPTGSGVTARMARDHARGLIAEGTPRRFIGPTGIPFHAEIAEAANDAVTVRVSGTSAFTGTAEFTVEPDDPLAYGFSLPESFPAIPPRPLPASP